MSIVPDNPRILNILFAASETHWREYETHLRHALRAQGLRFKLLTDCPPGQVDYIVYAPNSSIQNFTPYSNCRAVMNLWAGVENVVNNPTLTMPLTRMVDHGMTRGMVEWVTGHVLRHHLGTDVHVLGQDGAWRSGIPPLATDRPVTILGMGVLGRACGVTLSGLGFPVTGWSRSQKNIPGIRCFYGSSTLNEVLEHTQILVLLVPSTAATKHLICKERLACLPRGAVLINPGRGLLIDDSALIEALDSDQLAHATLDVFTIEPLPPEHEFWHHPKITVTPHIASATRPTSASKVIANNISRSEAGEPLLHLVNRQAGY